MYPKRKRRPQCSKCKYELNGHCYQRKYAEYDSAELEGNTNQKCGHFEEGTNKDKDKLVKKINEQVSTSTGGGCCLVLTLLGTGWEKDLNRVRKFRDKTLKSSYLGRKFVKFYYWMSPYVCSFIHDKHTLKRILKYMIIPEIKIISCLYK